MTMMVARFVVMIALTATLLSSCGGKDEYLSSNKDDVTRSKQTEELRSAMKKVEPFFKPMGKPEAYDWLGAHQESGQTFEEYLESDPTKPTNERQKIYVLPLGSFTRRQKETIDIAAGYLAVFYDLPVETMPNKLLPSRLDSKDTRYNEFLRTRQVRTGFIMDSILKPMLPNDAAALIAFTNEDLYPDDTMSYVFGQASLENRVGVWSLKRLEFKTDRGNFLLRTLKIATHETGHMFSMRHCTKYECVMSGTNHIAETDRRPIDACPECMAKICWFSKIAAAERYKRLAAYCRKHFLQKQADEFEKKQKSVS